DQEPLASRNALPRQRLRGISPIQNFHQTQRAPRDQQVGPIARQVIEERQLRIQIARQKKHACRDQDQWRDERCASHNRAPALRSSKCNTPRTISSTGHVFQNEMPAEYSSANSTPITISMMGPRIAGMSGGLFTGGLLSIASILRGARPSTGHAFIQ